MKIKEGDYLYSFDPVTYNEYEVIVVTVFEKNDRIYIENSSGWETVQYYYNEENNCFVQQIHEPDDEKYGNLFFTIQEAKKFEARRRIEDLRKQREDNLLDLRWISNEIIKLGKLW